MLSRLFGEFVYSFMSPVDDRNWMMPWLMLLMSPAVCIFVHANVCVSTCTHTGRCVCVSPCTRTGRVLHVSVEHRHWRRLDGHVMFPAALWGGRDSLWSWWAGCHAAAAEPRHLLWTGSGQHSSHHWSVALVVSVLSVIKLQRAMKAGDHLQEYWLGIRSQDKQLLAVTTVSTVIGRWGFGYQRWANPNRNSIWIAIFGTLGFDSSILGFDSAAHDWDLIRFVTFVIQFAPNSIRVIIAVASRHHVIRHIKKYIFKVLQQTYCCTVWL